MIDLIEETFNNGKKRYYVYVTNVGGGAGDTPLVQQVGTFKEYIEAMDKVWELRSEMFTKGYEYTEEYSNPPKDDSGQVNIPKKIESPVNTNDAPKVKIPSPKMSDEHRKRLLDLMSKKDNTEMQKIASSEVKTYRISAEEFKAEPICDVVYFGTLYDGMKSMVHFVIHKITSSQTYKFMAFKIIELDSKPIFLGTYSNYPLALAKVKNAQDVLLKNGYRLTGEKDKVFRTKEEVRKARKPAKSPKDSAKAFDDSASMPTSNPQEIPKDVPNFNLKSRRRLSGLMAKKDNFKHNIIRVAEPLSPAFKNNKCLYYGKWIQPRVNREYHIAVVEEITDEGVRLYYVFRQKGKVGQLGSVEQLTVANDYSFAMARIFSLKSDLNAKGFSMQSQRSRAPATVPESNTEPEDVVNPESLKPKEYPKDVPKMTEEHRKRLLDLMSKKDDLKRNLVKTAESFFTEEESPALKGLKQKNCLYYAKLIYKESKSIRVCYLALKEEIRKVGNENVDVVEYRIWRHMGRMDRQGKIGLNLPERMNGFPSYDQAYYYINDMIRLMLGWELVVENFREKSNSSSNISNQSKLPKPKERPKDVPKMTEEHRKRLLDLMSKEDNFKIQKVADAYEDLDFMCWRRPGCIYHSKRIKRDANNNPHEEWHTVIIEEKVGNRSLYNIINQYGTIGNLNSSETVAIVNDYTIAMQKVKASERILLNDGYEIFKVQQFPKKADENVSNGLSVSEKPKVYPKDVPKMTEEHRKRLLDLMSKKDKSKNIVKTAVESNPSASDCLYYGEFRKNSNELDENGNGIILCDIFYLKVEEDNGAWVYKVYVQYGRGSGNVITHHKPKEIGISSDHDSAMNLILDMRESRIASGFRKTIETFNRERESRKENDTNNVEAPNPNKEYPKDVPKMKDEDRERLMRLMAGEDPQKVFKRTG